MVDVALGCIDRGWYVFPCKPGGKEPLVPGGFKAASQDEANIRAWWGKWPSANVGIATGASGLTVLDIDHGIKDAEALGAFRMWNGLPETYTVRTGRRDGFGAQMYFKTGAEALKSIAWVDPQDSMVSGDVRGGTGYVLAAGSLHPSGAFYEALVEAPIAPTPAFVRSLKAAPVSGLSGGTNEAFQDDGGPIIGSRNVKMASVLGRLRGQGYDDDRLREAAETINETRCQPPLAEWELDRVVSNICKYPIPEAEPVVIIGKGQAPAEPLKHWSERYHSFLEMDEAPEPSFLIEGFLQEDSITGLAAPVAQRKSLIALNVAHALCTGEALFGRFAVTRKPSRVLYHCPEMGLISFTGRVRAIGLLPYVGKTLFCTTMNSERFKLDDLTEEELDGAVVILDTAIRFLEGDENSSEDMQRFAKSVFRLKKAGAVSIIVLHHSPKGTKESSELTLENVMRGSGELGAFVTSCWATRLTDPAEPYESPSFIVNVKQRDFQSEPFRATSDKHFKMEWLPEEEGVTATLKTSGADKDGKQAEAVQFIRDNQDMTLRELVAGLKALGIKRGSAWCHTKRVEIRGSGTTSAEE